MIIWEAVIEEIALEGLDGIAFPTLWLRLQSRPDTEFVLDDAGKQWIWNFVRQRGSILAFYQLAEPRPSLLASGDDEIAVDERAVYPIQVIADRPVWGSCAALDTRLDVTDQICSGDVCASLSDALECFGSDRSRYLGVNAGSTDSLHVLFNVRAKDVFYILKRFESFGITKKQIASMVVNQSKLVTANVVMLSRYSTPLDRSRYLAPMRKLIAFLEQKPDRRAPFAEVKELFGVVTAIFIKKMLHTFPGIIRTAVTKIEVPCTAATLKRKRKLKLKQVADGTVADNTASGDEEAINSSTASTTAEDAGESEIMTRKVILRHYELVGKLHLDEDTGELLSKKALSLDEPESTPGGGGDDEDDETGAVLTSDAIDWSRYNPFRTRTFETCRVIRQSGPPGIENRSLRQEIAVDRKQMERLLNNLRRGTQFKVVLENAGKRRNMKYVWSNAEHQSEQYYRKFQEVTRLDVSRLPDKERLILGERNIQRMLFILEYMEATPVVVSSEFLRPLRDQEQSQGYTHTLDKKCLASLLKFLSNHGQLKTFITVLKEGALQKTVEFVCHNRIQLSSPELQSKICSVRLELARLTSKRLGQQTKSGKEGHRSLAKLAEKLIRDEEDHAQSFESNGREDEGGEPPTKKRKRGPAPVQKSQILYDQPSPGEYGYQGRLTRAQLLHEFLYYLLLDIQASDQQAFEEHILFWEDAERTVPRVYVQDESWRRFVPPLPARTDLPKNWFRIGDILNRIPISLLTQITPYRHKIVGLEEEYLNDPVKRHYTLHHVPAELRAALLHERKAPMKLVEACNTLAAMGLLSYGRSRKQDSIIRLEDELYYIHASSRIMDTSAAPPSFTMVRGEEQYPDYVYRFSSIVDVHIFWLHARAVAFSTRLGMRGFRTEQDTKYLSLRMSERGNFRGFCPITPVAMDAVKSDGVPVEPRQGAAGFTPLLYLYRPVGWKINSNSFARWYFDEVRSRVCAYELVIAQRVSHLNSSWNAYFNFKPSVEKPTRPALRTKKIQKSKEITSSTRRQGWWPHPAVQKQLRQRKGNTVDKSNRKVRGELDAADEASYARRRKLRASFSAREKQMLLLMRAVSYVFYTGSRLWVEASVIRDLMHKYFPESRDKTSKALAQSSARDLGTNPQAGETMIIMAEQIQRHKTIRMIKRRLSTLPNGAKEKRWAFTKAFEVARKIFYGSRAGIDFDDIDLSTVFQEYDVSLENTSKTLWPMEDAHSIIEILENTTKRVVYSALGLSRRDGAFTSQFNMIYKSLPDALLLRVIQRLRRNGMLVLRARLDRSDARSKRVPGEPPSRRSGDFMLSFFYRHFFYHHFHISLAKEAKALLDTTKSRPDEWHNVLTDLPGFASALIALSWNKQVYFDLTVPSNVVVYNENNNRNRANATQANEGDDENDDWPRVISATTALLQSDDDDYEDAEPVVSFASTPVPSTSQQLPVVVKTEPETEAVHLACQSANKSVLFKLRQERLHACEATDSRSMNVRVRDLTLNSCALVAKLAPSFEDTSAYDQAKTRDATSKLVSDAAVGNFIEANGGGEMDTAGQTIQDLLNEKGALGLTEQEFQEQYGEDETMRRRLNEMIERGDVKACGVWKKRFVARAHIDPWAVTSVRFAKEDRSRAQIVRDASATQETSGDPVKFMPRPWLKPDGTLNKPMLRWLCEGIFLRIASLPNVTETYMQEQFISVMDPRETTELIEFLVNTGCVTRIVKEFNQRKPRLFGPPNVEKVTVVSYEIPVDAVFKFATAFEKTPMPEFVTSWLMGASVSDRGAVFGRRRMRPTPHTTV